MRIVEVANDPNSALGVAIASLVLNQMILAALVKRLLLPKEEAQESLTAAIASNESLSRLPANKLAAGVLRDVLSEVRQYPELTKS